MLVLKEQRETRDKEDDLRVREQSAQRARGRLENIVHLGVGQSGVQVGRAELANGALLVEHDVALFVVLGDMRRAPGLRS